MVFARVRTKAPAGRPVPPQIRPDCSIRTAFRTVGSYLTVISKPLINVVALSCTTTSTVRPPPDPGLTTAVGLSEIRGCRAPSVSPRYVAWQLRSRVPSKSGVVYGADVITENGKAAPSVFEP